MTDATHRLHPTDMFVSVPHLLAEPSPRTHRASCATRELCRCSDDALAEPVMRSGTQPQGWPVNFGSNELSACLRSWLDHSGSLGLAGPCYRELILVGLQHDSVSKQQSYEERTQHVQPWSASALRT